MSFFNSGLFMFLGNLIGEISDDWESLWANSAHTATTAPFLRIQASND